MQEGDMFLDKDDATRHFCFHLTFGRDFLGSTARTQKLDDLEISTKTLSIGLRIEVAKNILPRIERI